MSKHVLNSRIPHTSMQRGHEQRTILHAMAIMLGDSVEPCVFSYPGEGYLLHSGNPNRLWFRFRFWVKNPIQGNRLDRHRLLCEAEEELATAL